MWLEPYGLPVDPYAESDVARLPFYLQFHAPKRFRPVEAFARELAALASPDDEFLVSITDTIMPWDFELRMFDRLRPAGAPSLLEAPGHLFSRDEVGDMISMFSLSVALEWKAYLHVPKMRSILHNWEGEIFDFWSGTEAVFEAVSSLLVGFKLDETGSN